MKKLLTALVVLLPMAAAAQYEPVGQGSGYASRRSPWYIGFGIGGGAGNVSAWGTTDSLSKFNKSAWLGDPDTTELSLNFKVGATLSERLLVGFDITAVASLIAEGSQSSTVTIANYDAVATFFPMGEGLFVRGGVGLSRLTGSWDDGFTTGSEGVSGFNVLGGVGYAFWLGQRFNLTLNLDYSVQTFGSADFPELLADAFPMPESSNFLAFWVGFDWY